MQSKTLKEIEQFLNKTNDRENPILNDLLHDERVGVKKLINRWSKKIELEEKTKEKYEQMTVFERKYRDQGYQWIAGVDEVGRGPLAGPVVAAAVILPKNYDLMGIDDSKQLSEKKREEYYQMIQQNALAIGVGIVESETLDEINIYEATKKAMNIAIYSLDKSPEVVLIDAMKLETPYLVESIIKGDAKSVSIAAASIIAKVTRDRIMMDYALQYPEYSFDQNMGYGTKKHLEAIQNHGITPIHRKSFAPVKDFISR